MPPPLAASHQTSSRWVVSRIRSAAFAPSTVLAAIHMTVSAPMIIPAGMSRIHEVLTFARASPTTADHSSRVIRPAESTHSAASTDSPTISSVMISRPNVAHPWLGVTLFSTAKMRCWCRPSSLLSLNGDPTA